MRMLVSILSSDVVKWSLTFLAIVCSRPRRDSNAYNNAHLWLGVCHG